MLRWRLDDRAVGLLDSCASGEADFKACQDLVLKVVGPEGLVLSPSLKELLPLDHYFARQGSLTAAAATLLADHKQRGQPLGGERVGGLMGIIVTRSPLAHFDAAMTRTTASMASVASGLAEAGSSDQVKAY